MMTPINRNIFKKYDIRGRASGADVVITNDAARVIGHAFGTYAQRVDGKDTIVYSTMEYRPKCPDESKETVIQAVKTALGDRGEVIDVDGIRIRFDKGWGIIRASNTEPVLSLRFEGETEANALAYCDLFAEVLRGFPQVEQIT